MSVLYVTEQWACVKVKHQQFQVFQNNQLQISVPANQVSHIVLFGTCHLSHGTMSLALRRQIPVMFLSHQGRYFGRLEGEKTEIDYLIKQVERSLSKEFTLQQAKSIVTAKLTNYRTWLQRWNRSKKKSSSQVTKIIKELTVDS